MTLALPASIASFFRVSNGGTEPLSSCFAADAVVHDESHAYQGYASIQSWLEQARQKYLYKAKPVSYEQSGETVRVVATYTGTFPGSPADLTHEFRLTDDRIVFLEIH